MTRKRTEPTKAERYRQQQVMLAALAEEHRIMHLSREDLNRRMREILEHETEEK